MTDQFIQDIGTAFVYGFGFTSGVIAFVLVVLLLGAGIIWWMDK